MKAKNETNLGRVITRQGTGEVSLEQALDLYVIAMNGVRSPATISWYRSLLQQMVDYVGGNVSLEEVGIDDLRQWRATLVGRTTRFSSHSRRKELDGGLSPATLHAHVRACRTFFRWLVEDGKLTSNPAARLELPAKPKAIRKGISDEDRVRIIEAMGSDRSVNRVRNMAMIHFLDDSTCRAAGVVGLTLDNLNVERRFAWVHEKGLGGNRKERKVFFSPETAGLLKAWLAVRPACGAWGGGGCEFVFVTEKGAPLQVKGLYTALRRAAIRAGVKKGWNPHNWRHGTIRRMKKLKINLAVISALAGHSTVQLTGDLYGTLDEDELQAAVDGVMWKVEPGPEK